MVYPGSRESLEVSAVESPRIMGSLTDTGLSYLGVPTRILADQLTLFLPGGTDYAHLITIGTPGFSDLPTALDQQDFGGSLYT